MMVSIATFMSLEISLLSICQWSSISAMPTRSFPQSSAVMSQIVIIFFMLSQQLSCLRLSSDKIQLGVTIRRVLMMAVTCINCFIGSSFRNTETDELGELQKYQTTKRFLGLVNERRSKSCNADSRDLS